MDITDIIDNLFSETELCSVIYFDSLNSTNLYAKNNRITDNVCIITPKQFGGRGRFNRKWYSEPDKNLTITIVKEFDSSYRNLINFYTSFIILITLRKFTGLELEGGASFSLKWPNDVLMNGKKIAGVLTETGESDENRTSFVIGIGVNINQRNFDFESNYAASSLLIETGTEYSIVELINSLVVNFYSHINLLTSSMIMSFWRVNADFIGKNIDFRINDTNETVKGRVLSVEDDGAIIISGLNVKDKNQSQKYYSGEISFIYS